MTQTAYSSSSLWAGGNTSMVYSRLKAKFDGTEPLILIIPGHGSTPAIWDQGSEFGVHFAALAEAGYICLVVDQPELWSNDARMTELSAAVAYGQGTLGAKAGKIGVFGHSLGGGDSLNFIKRNLSIIAGAYLFCPATDYDYLYGQGYGAEMDAAYGGSFATNKAGHVPLTDAAALRGGGVPIKILQGDADTTVLPSQTAAYVAAVNDPLVTERILPNGNHGLIAEFASVDDTVVFFRSHLT